MSYSIKQISDTSYILSHLGERKAILTKTDSGISAIGNLQTKKFSDWQDLEKHLGSIPVYETEAEESVVEVTQISGYPVKHSPVYDVSDNPVSYSKVAGSKTRFAAGYYCIRFEAGWVPAFCPKLSTLTGVDTLGPFTTKLEMTNALTNIKNKPTV